MQPCDLSAELLLRILSLVDLTSLNDSDTEESIRSLCKKADNLVAAVCIYPHFITTAKDVITSPHIKIATVCNFPSGKSTVAETVAEIQSAIETGANEVDVVLPYHRYWSGDRSYVREFLFACREATSNNILKIIIETGALPEELIIQACHDVIAAKADFIKTSTGKISSGVTLQSARIILSVITEQQANIGIKLSGGIRDVNQVLDYFTLTQSLMGDDWITASHFRIGASKLVDNILQHESLTVT